MVGMLALARKSLSSRATGTDWTPDADCGIASLEKREEEMSLVSEHNGKKGLECS